MTRMPDRSCGTYAARVPLHELARRRDRGRWAQADVAVVVGPATEHGAFARCLRSLLQHTAPTVPIVVLADASTDPAHPAMAGASSSRRARSSTTCTGSGARAAHVARGWTLAAAAVAPADVVLLHPDCVVADGWLDGLRAAVRSAGNLASATALSNHAAFASVPHRNLPWALLPPELTVRRGGPARARRLAADRARVPTALPPLRVGHPRRARPRRGLRRDARRPPRTRSMDFSQACVAHGLQHVLADDVLVMHRGGASGGDGPATARSRDAPSRTSRRSSSRPARTASRPSPGRCRPPRAGSPGSR